MGDGLWDKRSKLKRGGSVVVKIYMSEKSDVVANCDNLKNLG